MTPRQFLEKRAGLKGFDRAIAKMNPERLGKTVAKMRKTLLGRSDDILKAPELKRVRLEETQHHLARELRRRKRLGEDSLILKSSLKNYPKTASISFGAFCDECTKIKVAQAELSDDTERRERMLRVAKALAHNVGAGAVGYGLGHGLGYAGAEGLRRTSLYPRTITPTGLHKARALMSILGGAGGVASLAAFNAAQRRIAEDWGPGGEVGRAQKNEARGE
jgi:hypothetical protein